MEDAGLFANSQYIVNSLGKTIRGEENVFISYGKAFDESKNVLDENTFSESGKELIDYVNNGMGKTI